MQSSTAKMARPFIKPKPLAPNPQVERRPSKSAHVAATALAVEPALAAAPKPSRRCAPDTAVAPEPASMRPAPAPTTKRSRRHALVSSMAVEPAVVGPAPATSAKSSRRRAPISVAVVEHAEAAASTTPRPRAPVAGVTAVTVEPVAASATTSSRHHTPVAVESAPLTQSSCRAAPVSSVAVEPGPATATMMRRSSAPVAAATPSRSMPVGHDVLTASGSTGTNEQTSSFQALLAAMDEDDDEEDNTAADLHPPTSSRDESIGPTTSSCHYKSCKKLAARRCVTAIPLPCGNNLCHHHVHELCSQEMVAAFGTENFGGVVCGKRCFNSLIKIPAAADVSTKKRVPWHNDGLTPSISSLTCLLDWMTKGTNYKRYTGGKGQTGEAKLTICQEVVKDIAEAGITTERTAKDVMSKISALEQVR